MKLWMEVMGRKSKKRAFNLTNIEESIESRMAEYHQRLAEIPPAPQGQSGKISIDLWNEKFEMIENILPDENWHEEIQEEEIEEWTQRIPKKAIKIIKRHERHWAIRIGQTIIMPAKDHDEYCTQSYLLQEQKPTEERRGELIDPFVNTKQIKKAKECIIGVEEEEEDILKPAYRKDGVSVFKCQELGETSADKATEPNDSSKITALFALMKSKGSESITISTGVSTESATRTEENRDDRAVRALATTLKRTPAGMQPKLIIVPVRSGMDEDELKKTWWKEMEKATEEEAKRKACQKEEKEKLKDKTGKQIDDYETKLTEWTKLMKKPTTEATTRVTNLPERIETLRQSIEGTGENSEEEELKERTEKEGTEPKENEKANNQGVSLAKMIIADETEEMEKVWQSLTVWKRVLDEIESEKRIDLRSEIRGRLKKDQRNDGGETTRMGDPELFSAGKEECRLHPVTRTPQGRIMCPWMQESCPILKMQLGDNLWTKDEKEALKLAHWQTAIHEDENIRETWSREQSKADEIHGKVSERIRAAQVDETEETATASAAASEEKDKKRIRRDNKEKVNLTALIERNILNRIKDAWGIPLGSGWTIDPLKNIEKPVRKDGEPEEDDKIAKELKDYTARLNLEIEMTEAEKEKLPSPLWCSVKGGKVGSLMKMVKGESPITKIQVHYQNEVWMTNPEEILATKEQLRRISPTNINDSQPGWKEWEKTSKIIYNNPDLIKTLEIYAARKAAELWEEEIARWPNQVADKAEFNKEDNAETQEKEAWKWVKNNESKALNLLAKVSDQKLKASKPEIEALLVKHIGKEAVASVTDTLKPEYVDKEGNDAQKKIKERVRDMMIDIVRWLGIESAMMGVAENSNRMVSARTIRAITSVPPRNLNRDDKEVMAMRKEVTGHEHFSEQMAIWVKEGLHNIGIPWTYGTKQKPKKEVLCAAYTVLSRCCGTANTCPFKHDTKLRDNLGRTDKTERWARIRSIMEAELVRQEDGVTVHLKRIKLPNEKEAEPWTSKTYTPASSDEIRYESYFDENEKETEKEEDSMKKDVAKNMKMMTEYGAKERDEHMKKLTSEIKANYELASNEIRLTYARKPNDMPIVNLSELQNEEEKRGILAARIRTDRVTVKTEDEREETWTEANDEKELVKNKQKPVTARILASQYAEKSQEPGIIIYGDREPWDTANDIPSSVIIREITNEPIETNKDGKRPRENTLAFRIKGMLEALNDMFKTNKENVNDRARLKKGEVAIFGNCHTYNAYDKRYERATTIAGYTLPRQSIEEREDPQERIRSENEEWAAQVIMAYYAAIKIAKLGGTDIILEAPTNEKSGNSPTKLARKLAVVILFTNAIMGAKRIHLTGSEESKIKLIKEIEAFEIEEETVTETEARIIARIEGMRPPQRMPKKKASDEDEWRTVAQCQACRIQTWNHVSCQTCSNRLCRKCRSRDSDEYENVCGNCGQETMEEENKEARRKNYLEKYQIQKKVTALSMVTKKKDLITIEVDGNEEEDKEKYELDYEDNWIERSRKKGAGEERSVITKTTLDSERASMTERFVTSIKRGAIISNNARKIKDTQTATWLIGLWVSRDRGLLIRKKKWGTEDREEIFSETREERLLSSKVRNKQDRAEICDVESSQRRQMPGARQGFNRKGYDQAFGKEAKRMWDNSMIIGTNETGMKILKSPDKEEDEEEDESDDENEGTIKNVTKEELEELFRRLLDNLESQGRKSILLELAACRHDGKITKKWMDAAHIMAYNANNCRPDEDQMEDILMKWKEVKKVFGLLAEYQNSNMIRASENEHWPKLPTIPIKATLLQSVKPEEAEIIRCDETEQRKRVMGGYLPETMKDNPIDEAVKEAIKGKAVTMIIDADLAKWSKNIVESQGTIEAELIQRSNFGMAIRNKNAEQQTSKMANRVSRPAQEHWLFQNVMIFRKGRNDGYRMMKNPVLITVMVMFPEDGAEYATKQEKELFRFDRDRKKNDERIRTAIQRVALMQTHSGENQEATIIGIHGSEAECLPRNDVCESMVKIAMESRIKGVRFWISKERNVEDTEGSTLEEIVNHLILRKIGRELKKEIKATVEENQHDEQRGVIETNQGEVTYSTAKRKPEFKRRRGEGDDKNEEEKAREKIRKILSEEAAKRATVKRAKAYEEENQDRIDEEPPRRRFRADKEKAKEANERRGRIRELLDKLERENEEIQKREDEEEHGWEIERCLMNTPLNNVGNGDFLENRITKRRTPITKMGELSNPEAAKKHTKTDVIGPIIHMQIQQQLHGWDVIALIELATDGEERFGWVTMARINDQGCETFFALSSPSRLERRKDKENK